MVARRKGKLTACGLRPLSLSGSAGTRAWQLGFNGVGMFGWLAKIQPAVDPESFYNGKENISTRTISTQDFPFSVVGCTCFKPWHPGRGRGCCMADDEHFHVAWNGGTRSVIDHAAIHDLLARSGSARR
ncbi:hypothetical protein BQ8482_270003 [Mesorhizobium delmotii]|uniref:Uncharacterized protein n=1 Tax=Mesorhizobium delmotii TaxID=1631247 RepID=A0A2P9AM86_9HYPH|nr:hypothetical protein BQ8482_270003 [Mesorhizobium delmotii]